MKRRILQLQFHLAAQCDLPLPSLLRQCPSQSTMDIHSIHTHTSIHSCKTVSCVPSPLHAHLPSFSQVATATSPPPHYHTIHRPITVLSSISTSSKTHRSKSHIASSTSTDSIPHCWNCHAPSPMHSNDPFFCPSCNVIQPAFNHIDYYTIFNMYVLFLIQLIQKTILICLSLY